MRIAYTDVDRLILDRWHDTMSLFEAYEELEGRIQETISEVSNRLSHWASDREYTVETDTKRARYYAFKSSWMNRRRDEALVYFSVENFAPLGYRKIKDAHPSLWVCIDTLRIKGVEHEEFARELRSALGEEASAWQHDNATDDYPLGKLLSEITDKDRVAFVGDPERLFAFGKEAFEQLFPLAVVIDQTLTKVRSRE